MLTVTRIDHVGVAVWDIPSAVSFLATQLGLSADEDPVQIPSQAVSVQFWSAGDTKLELLAPSEMESPLGRYLRGHGEGLHHVCFETPDIASKLDQLRAADVPLVDEEAWLSPHGWAAYIHPKAWSGCAIELREKVL